MLGAHVASEPATASGKPISSPLPGVAAGGVEKKHTKKRKKRVRGEKARERTVLRQDERPAEVKLGRGRIRELDVAARSSTEAKMPRKMRALFAAKRGLEAKAAAKQQCAKAAVTPLGRGAPAAKDPAGAAKKAPVAKRKSNRELVIETVKKTTRQYEKRKAFHAKREERAAVAKEKKKRRRRKSRMGSDCEEEEGFSAGGEEDEINGSRTGRNGRYTASALGSVAGFTSRAQAQAPPKLKAVVERHQRQKSQETS